MPHNIQRLFQTNCSSCGETIPSSELVIKIAGNVYHIKCFICVVCQCRLEKGQDFALKHNKLYCKQHFQEMENMIDHKQDNDNFSSDAECNGKKTIKRSRTILTREQLNLFRSSFEISAKPCRKVREELSQETGLSVRVVQVWFQNQRAKVKKLSRRDRFSYSNVTSYRMTTRQPGRKLHGGEDCIKNGYNNPLIMGQPGTFSLPLASHYTTLNPVILPRQYPLTNIIPNQAMNSLTFPTTMPQPGEFLELLQLTEGIQGIENHMPKQRYNEHFPLS